jgi:Fe-S oxidoreductase
VQRAAVDLAAPFQPAGGRPGPYPLQMLRSPLPKVPSETLRDVIPPCEPDQVLVFEPPPAESADRSAAANGDGVRSVFYFPGCGSERYQSHISMAALHVLVSLGVRVVLPPPYLCCGFPAHVNAKDEQHSRQVLRDTILFSQIREMFSYLEFDGCVITCGTCREGLAHMDAGKLFGGRLVDVAAYALERGLTFQGSDTGMLYHPPCHDSLEGKAEQVLVSLGGFGKVETVPHCCSEAGTLALSRPDITDAMLHRKRHAFEEHLGDRRQATVLTNCPSCVSGLSRNKAMGIEPKHLAVAMAEKISGEGWLDAFRAQAARAHAVHF